VVILTGRRRTLAVPRNWCVRRVRSFTSKRWWPSRPLALRHRRCAVGRSGCAIDDPRAPLLEMVPLMLVLLMSAVPVALPVMFTVSMAVGRRSWRSAACWSRALAPGGCRDDGRALRGQDRHDHDEPSGCYRVILWSAHGIRRPVCWRTRLSKANQDPIDLALLARQRSGISSTTFQGHPVVLHTVRREKPGGRKHSRTEREAAAREMKGAVRPLPRLADCSLWRSKALEAQVSESALKGYRTLAVARGPEIGAPALGRGW